MTDLKRRVQGLGRDQIFWLVVAVVVIAYIILRGDALSMVATLIGLVIAITVHECAHAWMADQLGDPTARYMGRVSLNPLVHLDPMGSVMILVTSLLGTGIGWGKPTPVNPTRLRYGSRVGNAIVSLAGPVSNLIVGLALGLLLRVALLGNVPYWLNLVLFALVSTNVVIAMFNLIPIPPLDGFAVLLGLISLIPGRWAWNLYQWLSGLQRYGAFLLLGLIILSQFVGINVIGWWVLPPTRLFLRLVVGTGY
jgi:Zn-dependent protease